MKILTLRKPKQRPTPAHSLEATVTA